MAVKTMINSPTFGRFSFDAVFDTSHNANLMVTEHPVQSGGSVADHAFMEPDEVQLEIGMTDVVTSSGTVEANHSVNAYARLRSIMEAREPVTLVTRLKTYQNMLIVTISAPDDYTTMNALKASVGFKQINIVSVSTVKVQQTVSASTTTAQTGSLGGGGGSGGSTNKPPSSSSSKPPKKTSVLQQVANKVKAAVKPATKVTTTKVAKKITTAVLQKAKSATSKFTMVMLK